MLLTTAQEARRTSLECNDHGRSRGEGGCGSGENEEASLDATVRLAERIQEGQRKCVFLFDLRRWRQNRKLLTVLVWIPSLKGFESLGHYLCEYPAGEDRT